MIYIFVALYPEAKHLIETLQLKKRNSAFKFQQYYSEDGICLTITGCGSIAASTAVGAVCACGEIKDNDILINIGTCAGDKLKLNRIYLVHKMTEYVTGRTFYPDMLYGNSFEEAELVTMPVVMSNRREIEAEHLCESGLGGEEANIQTGKVLYDMEGTAIYQAGAYFVGPHQMQFLKVVSDGGDGEAVTPKAVEGYMQLHLEVIVQHIRRMQKLSQELGCRAEVFTEEEGERLAKLGSDLHCSATMQAELEQLCRFWKLSGVPYEDKILSYYEQGTLPCRDKREGKVWLNELRRELL